MAQASTVSNGLKRAANQVAKPAPGWLRRAREQQARWRVPGVPFSVGQKQVFLPNFTITLLRTPFLGPKWAQFMVPLNLNKFDLRDYLFNAYSVRTLSIRSFIKQLPIQRVQKGSIRDLPGRRQLYRPKSLKRMTVELEKPFVWPETPEDLEPWDHQRYHQLTGEAATRVLKGGKGGKEGKGKRLTIGDQAQMLLRGQSLWKSVDPSVRGNGSNAGSPL